MPDFRVKLSQGIVGQVVATKQALVLGDVTTDPHYIEVVPGMASSMAVPLVHKNKPIGALNILSREPRLVHRARRGDPAPVRRARSSTALVNARLFEQQRLDAEAFETLAEIGREVAAVLDLDELLSRIAQLARRVVDYRTFGILLLDEQTKMLEMKVAVQYGEKVELPKVALGEGLVGYAAFHREAVLVPDVSKDPRYIKVVEDVRSELAVPMLLKDRCIGVFDLESPELDAFSKRDVEILTLLASQAAVAIENARLYQALSANEARLETRAQVRQARPDRASAVPVTQEGQGRRARRVVRAGARAGRRLPRFPAARLDDARHRARRRLRQGRAGGALQRVCRGAGARPHVPAPVRA